MPTAKLPMLRKSCAIFSLASGVLCLMASMALLIYQLKWTSGYQRPLPAIIIAAIFSSILPPFFVYSPSLGANKVALFCRSIAFELISNAGITVLSLIAVANLHAQTPGLLFHCGKFLTCRMLAATLALTWLVFFFAACSFTLVLLGLLYFVYKRKSPIPSLITPFSDVDWQMYEGKVRRSVHRLSHRVGPKAQDLHPLEKFTPTPPPRLTGEERAACEVSIIFDDEEPSARRRSLNWGRRNLEEDEREKEKEAGTAL